MWIWRKIRHGLVKTLNALIMLVMGTLVLTVLWQVFTRFILGNPATWTEELATTLLVWVAILGASVAFAERAHLGVDVLFRLMPERKRLLADIVIQVIIIFFSATLLVHGGGMLVKLTLQTGQMLATLPIPRGYVYMVMPLSGVFIILFSVEMILEDIMALRGRKAESLPGEQHVEVNI